MRLAGHFHSATRMYAAYTGFAGYAGYAGFANATTSATNQHCIFNGA